MSTSLHFWPPKSLALLRPQYLCLPASEECSMSVADLRLTPHESFVSPVPQGRLEQPSARSEPLTKHYYGSLRRTQSELNLKKAQLRRLLDLTNGMVAHVELNDVLRNVTVGSRRLMQSDFALLGLLDLPSGRLRVNAFEFADDTMLDEETVNSFGEMLAAHVYSTGKPWTGISADLIGGMDLNDDVTCAAGGFKSLCCILPLNIRGLFRRIFPLGNTHKIDYPGKHTGL